MKLLVACLLSSLLTVCFVSGCTPFAYNEIGTVWTIPHPKFSEISAQHELVAVMPISIRSDLKKNSKAFRDATRLENDEEYVGDLQRFLNAKLMHGTQQGRITVQVQDVEETIKLLDQELQRKEKQGRRNKIAKTRACELLQVDVVAYVELTISDMSEQEVNAGDVRASYYECKSGKLIWTFKQALETEKLIHRELSVEESLLKHVAMFFPYEVIL